MLPYLAVLVCNPLISAFRPELALILPRIVGLH